MDRISIDSRLKSKIENIESWDQGSCSLKFKDLDDTFWFKDEIDLQEFIRNQERERFYDKELRKGYFLYTNEHDETFKYTVEANRGKLTLVKEEFVESV